MIDSPPVRAVAITGRGAVSSLGGDRASLWQSVRAGVCGIGPITRFDTARFTVSTGAQVTALADLPPTMSERDATAAEAICTRMSVRAIREAMTESQRCAWTPNARVALVFGTGMAELLQPLDEMVAALARECGIHGTVLTISTACSSSTSAIGVGLELLSMSAADIVIAGGADVLTPEVFAGFHALGVLTTGCCAPFSVPAGTSLGEGAAFLVLEPPADARRRGATVFGGINGYGLSCDAFHETSPDPKGGGIERAISAALLDATLAAPAVEYVNAHGSGTQANDSAEWLGIQRALGARAAQVPVSSTKGALGHAQGAAGALEAIVTLEAMRHGVLPPTLNFTVGRPHAPSDPIPGPRPRETPVARSVSVSAAFGGANSAIVLALEPDVQPRRAARAIRLRSLGVAGGFADGSPVAELPDLAGEDLRRLDPSARSLVVATTRALEAAAYRVTGGRRDRTGLVIGQRRPSPASLRDFAKSIDDHGLPQLSTSAFARIVLNAAAGSCARLLSLRGPHTVLTTGSASGLTAVVLAAQYLAMHDDAEVLIAGAVDERHDEIAAEDALVEGAICATLSSEPTAAGIVVAGWGIAAGGDLASAIALAMPTDRTCEAAQVRSDPRALGACTGLVALRDGVALLTSRAATDVLVMSDVPGVVSVALLLSTHELT